MSSALINDASSRVQRIRTVGKILLLFGLVCQVVLIVLSSSFADPSSISQTSRPAPIIAPNVVTAPSFDIFPSTATNVPCAVGVTCSWPITITPQNGFTGTVSFTAIPPFGLACKPLTPITLPPATQTTLYCTPIVAGSFGLTVTGSSGTLSNTTAVITFNAPLLPDFSISLGRSTPGILFVGSIVTSSITVSSTSLFSGQVSLHVSTSLSGANCAAPATVSVPSQSALTCSPNVAANYAVTVTGTAMVNGLPITHTGSVSFVVFDFSISANAATPSPVVAQSSASSTITVTFLNGWDGTVEFTVSDSSPSGLSCTTPALVYGGGIKTSTLTCSAQEGGNYTVTVTGTIGSLSHSTASILFHVIGFKVTASPPAVTRTGQNATATITVTPENGFTGTITLSISAPSGITCSLDHTTLQGSGTATLTCTSNAPKDYTVTVTANGGAAPRTTSETFHFSAAPSSAAPAPTILGLSPSIFYGIIGGLIAAAIGGIVIVVRRKSP